MHHKLSLIVLEILYLGADGSSSQVIPTLACAMAWDLWLWQNSAAMSSPRWHVRRHGIYGCGLSLSSVLS
jgi:hypothetical protein